MSQESALRGARIFLGYALGCGLVRRGAGQHGIVRGVFVFVVVRIDVIAAHGVVLESFPHEQATEVWMAGEDDSVKVEDFALLKFG